MTQEDRKQRVVEAAIELSKQFKWVRSMQHKLLGESLFEAMGHWEFATDQGTLNFEPLLNAVELYKQDQQKEIA